jgi:hypothetical protein
VRLVDTAVVFGLEMEMRPGRASAAGRKAELRSRTHVLSEHHGHAAVAHMEVEGLVGPAVVQRHEVPLTGVVRDKRAIGLAVLNFDDRAVQCGIDRHADVLLPERDEHHVDPEMAIVRVAATVEVAHYARRLIDVDGLAQEHVFPQNPRQRIKRISRRLIGRIRNACEERRQKSKPHLLNLRPSRLGPCRNRETLGCQEERAPRFAIAQRNWLWR